MWRLRFLGRVTVIRKLVKFIIGCYYYHGRVVVIQRGPLRGMSWFCNREHQFWMPLGVYEKETTQWLENQIQTDTIFFDIGANAGYFSLLGSRIAKCGKVISFEPVPTNIETIKSHISENKINNIIIEPIVISDKACLVEFSIEKTNANSHISDVKIEHAVSNPLNTINVQSVTLDEFSLEKKITPNVVKMDVEGAEVKVLMGAANLLKSGNAVWIISTHSTSLYEDCKNIMQSYGYRIDSLHGFHHELLCYPGNHNAQ